MNRLFLAIPVRLYDYPKIQHDFGPLLHGRWRSEEGLHVTIAFLGNTYQAETVIHVLKGLDASFDRSLLDGWDYFSNSRVFVATTQNPSLQALYERLAVLLNLEPSTLHPHATLMRVKRLNEPEPFFERLKMPPSETIGHLLPKLILYRSILRPDGALYHPLHEWIP